MKSATTTEYGLLPVAKSPLAAKLAVDEPGTVVLRRTLTVLE